MASLVYDSLLLVNKASNSTTWSNGYLSSCSPVADNVFGPQVTTDCRSFDFTLLFEQSFFSIGPSVALLIAAPVRIFLLHGTTAKVAGGPYQKFKLAILVLFAQLQLAVLIASGVSGDHSVKTTTSIASTTLSFIVACVLCLLSYIEHVKNIRTSDLISIYFFFSAIFDVVLVRTLWLLRFDTLVSSLFSCSLAMKLLITVLEARSKTNYYLTEADRHRGPEEISGIFNRGVFWFLNKLILQGFRNPLSMSDLYPLDESMLSKFLVPRFTEAWLSTKTRGNYRLIISILKALKWQFMAPIVPRLVLLAFTFCQPLLITRLLDFLAEPTTDESTNIGWGLIGAYGLVYLGLAFSTGFYYHQLFRFITMVRGNLVTAIYRKTTEISLTALDNSAAVTLMSADVERIVQGLHFIHELWANILSVGLATYLLQRELGVAAAFPIIVAVAAGLGSSYSSSRARSAQLGWIKKIQARIDTTSVMLSSIKGVKMSGLIRRFADTIQRLRLEEISAGRNFRMIQVATAILAYVPTQLSPVVTFIAFIGLSRTTGVTLGTSRLFTSISLFQVLATPLQQLFQVLPTMLAAKGCFERIQEFLLAETRSDTRVACQNIPTSERNASNIPTVKEETKFGNHNTNSLTSSQMEAMAIMVRNGTFGWDQATPVLQNVDFTVNQSKLTLLVGPIASGKSTLLKAILGETPVSEGGVYMWTTDVAFCDQTPWLTNDSIRNSIIGFSEFDETWYQSVLFACGLPEDLRTFTDGDATLIGSSGISLSGGQRQRVAIARAVYSRKPMAIFDDVFSGFDLATERIVFERVFGPAGLFRHLGTTVLLATHSQNFFQFADRVLTIKDGNVVELDNPVQLATAEYSKQISTALPINDDDKTIKILPGPIRESITATGSEEKKNTHQSDLSVYLYYFGCLGILQTIIFFFLQAAYAFLAAFPSVWLSWWSNANNNNPDQSPVKYLAVYSALQVLGLMALGLVAWQTMGDIIASTGAQLHKRILDTVAAAPLSFFSTTDKGITTNRFSQDLQIIDTELPLNLLNTILIFLGTIASAGLVASSSYYTALAFPPIFVIFYFLQVYYLRTSRQLRILDLETKSPLYTQFIDTLSGLATIRAFQWQEANHKLNNTLLDSSQKPFYLLFMVQRWLTLVLDIVGAALAVFIVTLAVKLTSVSSTGFTGVALINLITFTDSIKDGILSWTNLETSIGAVSRIKAFEASTLSEKLPREVEVPPENWPKTGEVKIQNLSASYKPGSYVLNDVTLHIKAGEKVGICGRSGSGKSTLILALARMIEISAGTISIDSQDLSLIPRDTIRSCLNIVPQEPFFLYGTIRLNLDPSGGATTLLIETALRRVGLYDLVNSKGGLDVQMNEEFLSHGQRQLFCLARALLRPGKILALDEVTSSVDLDTDVLMQQIIREEFKEHTIIAIAHRLETIKDFDRVVVMDEGKIVECDAPETLLAKEGSAFKKLFEMYKTPEGI